MTPMTRARTLWEEGHHPARWVVTAASAALVAVALLDVALGWQLRYLFGAGFVLAAVAQALLVRPGDFWPVVFAPPAQLLGVCALLTVIDPAALAAGDPHRVQAFVTGLAGLATPLAIGCVLAWGAVWIRLRVQAQRGSRPAASPSPAPAGRSGTGGDSGTQVPASDQSSNLDGSPAPTRTTSG